MNESTEQENRILRKLRERRLEKEAQKKPEPLKLQSLSPSNRESETNLEKSRKRRSTIAARWVSGIFSVIFGSMAAGYAFLPQFRFDDIQITGMEKINKAEIVYFTGAKGEPVFTVDPSRIRTTLLQHYQDIYDADVTIDFPAKMSITLTERVPVVEWDFGGSRFWIDQDGKVLSESRSQESTIHVYADSYPGAPNQADRELPLYFSRDTLKTIMTMGSFVPEDQPLIYTYKNGFGWDTDEGWRVFFGKTDSDIEEKLRMQESLTRYFHENDIKPIFLSLEFKDAPYYRFVEN